VRHVDDADALQGPAHAVPPGFDPGSLAPALAPNQAAGAFFAFLAVIPAKAGIRSQAAVFVTLDARFRGHDGIAGTSAQLGAP
jgi:hypothetical protein